MKRFYWIISLILATNGCALSPFGRVSETPVEDLDTSAPIIETTSPFYLSTSLLTETPAMTLTPYAMELLSCDTYRTLAWGDGDLEIGFPPVNHPIVFNDQGDIFLSDWSNERILKLRDASRKPIIIDVRDWFPEYESYAPPDFIVAEETIYLLSYPFASTCPDTLIMLSLFGDKVEKVELPRCISTALHDHPIISGKDFIMLQEGWLGGDLWVPRKVALISDDMEIRTIEYPYFGRIPNFMVGWDGLLYELSYRSRVSDIIIYAWGSDYQFLFHSPESRPNPDRQIEITDPAMDIMGWEILYLGIDIYSRIYMRVKPKPHYDYQYMRLDPFGVLDAIASLPEDMAREFSISPQGEMYAFEYDKDHLEVLPRIIRCTFNDR